MSARVESASVGRFNVGAIAVAVVVALGIGGLAGLPVTRATEERPAAVTTPAGNPVPGRAEAGGDGGPSARRAGRHRGYAALGRTDA
jgi:hypothetical protein